MPSITANSLPICSLTAEAGPVPARFLSMTSTGAAAAYQVL